MARLYRIVCTALLLVLFSAGAWASFPAQSGDQFKAFSFYTGQYIASPTYTSRDAAAAESVATCNGWSTNYTCAMGSWTGAVSHTVSFNLKSTGAYSHTSTYNVGLVTVSFCPTNATLGGTTCTCGGSYVQVGTTSTALCMASVPLWKLELDSLNQGGTVLRAEASGGGLKTCYQGVEVTATGIAFALKDGAPTGHTEYFGPFSGSGVACTASPTVGAAAPSPCKAGEAAGSVNGVSVCIPAQSVTVEGPKVAASGAGASLGSGTGAPTGSVSSSSSTNCTEAKCVETTTFKDAAGAVTGSTTKDVPKTTFCADNPGLSICKTSTYGSASCAGTAPSCSGDAVQCAIAAQTWATSCALKPDSSQESQLYTTESVKTGSVIGSLPGGQSFSLGPSSFSQADALGVAALGVADLEVVIGGRSMSLPMSKVNPGLALLGNVLLAVTFVLCARIVTRG